MNQEHVNTVRLLLAAAPAIFESSRFAMKGGTALNLFVQDLPRLSVDIDVAFTDYTLDRVSALKAISDDLSAAKLRVEKLGYSATVARQATGEEWKMFVEAGSASVKVEVNVVFRGTVFPIERRSLVKSAQDTFTTSISVPSLQAPELYGSKLVAAMDRQHPRDFFDVQTMLAQFGLDTTFVDCFVAYLAGHGRPVHEVLFPTTRRIEQPYRNQFVGLTRDEVTLESLLRTQTEIQSKLPAALTQAHRDFLLSLVKLEPAWELMPFEHLRDLPALRWKLQNLTRLKANNRAQFHGQFAALSERFEELRRA